ncbi:MAG: hypothetical protein ACI976_002385, partial [Aureispira sp.]
EYKAKLPSKPSILLYCDAWTLSLLFFYGVITKLIDTLTVKDIPQKPANYHL